MSDHSDEQQRALKIAEDVPAMRSVSLMPRAVPMIPLRGSPAPLQKSLSRPNDALEPLSVDMKSPPVLEAASWNVSKALTLPPYYQLERTNICIPNLSCVEVSKRISDCLCKESVAATFDDKQALAEAHTNHSVKFAVRLWEAIDQIIVEIQRTSGCCFLYQQIAKTIMRAAKFGSAPSVAPPRSMPRCVPQVPDSEWEASTVEALEIACNSLKLCHRLDAHVLAIESLVQLSEASRCRGFCAKNLLAADSELLSTILSLIQCSRMKDCDSVNHELLATGLEQDHFQVMHRHALTILANCLHCLRESGELSAPVVECLPELTSDATLSALVHDVAAASVKPHEAAAACRCLQVLLRYDACRERVLQLGAAGHVAAAAQCRHAILQRESSLLMRDL